MKKKILVFMLLFAVLVGVLVPAAAPVPVQAANSTETTADDVKYRDIEDFMHSAGYYLFEKNEDSLYIVSNDGTTWFVEEITGVKDSNPFWLYDRARGTLWFFADIAVTKGMCKYYNYYSPSEASIRDNFDAYSSGQNGYGTSNGVYWNGSNRYYACNKGNVNDIVYSDLDVYEVEPITTGTTNYVKNTDNVYFESTVYGNFSFPVWCQYAGLNCLASSNESSTVIPYSFNSYWHIVRKSSSGNWLLTTIGSTLGQSKMNLRLSDSGDLIIYEYSGEDSFTISVRQYVYDTDGWKVRTYDTYDYDDFSSGLLTLPAGSGLDDTRVLAYTSTDIYSSDGLSVYAAASTEYVEPSAPDVTPEPTPGSGSSGSADSDDTGSDDTGSSGGSSSGSGGTVVGGDAKPGGMLDFLVTLATLVWTELFAVEVSVDGYMISFQQIVIYSAVVGMLIWGGCKLFGKKG